MTKAGAVTVVETNETVRQASFQDVLSGLAIDLWVIDSGHRLLFSQGDPAGLSDVSATLTAGDRLTERALGATLYSTYETCFKKAMAGERFSHSILKHSPPPNWAKWGEGEQSRGGVLIYAGQQVYSQREIDVLRRNSEAADLATGVLHNIGNVLTSIMTSTSVIRGVVEKSSALGLLKANALLRAHIDKIEDFILNDPKGPKLLQYYLRLDDEISSELATLREQATRVMTSVDTIHDIICVQQDFASSRNKTERLSLRAIVDEALMLFSGSVEKYNIKVEKALNEDVRILANKTKLLQILVNLLKNAKEALLEGEGISKIIRVDTIAAEDKVCLRISDTGCGISEANLGRLFTRGFTTKDDGHGFGLPSCVDYMKEMGGKIFAESEGPGKGSTFTLSFPIKRDLDHERITS
jgi:signal transduction histidine kinase